jgi:Ca2+-binding EF-hand superfamily protein
MGGAESVHQNHEHHKNISKKVGKTYEEDGVVVLSDTELKHLWEHYDENKNNLLDKHELELVVADMIEHTITKKEERDEIKKKINEKGDFVGDLFKQLDADNDGVVNFKDFCSSYHKILNHYLSNH